MAITFSLKILPTCPLNLHLPETPIEPSNFTFEEFIDLTAEDAVTKRHSFPEEDLRDYLWYIAKLQIGLKEDVSKKNIPEAAGILLLISSTGDIKVAGLPNMLFLKLQDRGYIQQIHQQQNQEITQDILETTQDLEQSETLEQSPIIKDNIQKYGGISL